MIPGAIRVFASAAALVVIGALAMTGCGPRSAGSGTGGARAFSSPGRQPGRVSKPRAVAVSDDNRVVVVDRSGRVQLFDLETGAYLSKWELPDWRNGTPTGITLDPADGSLWIADTHYQRILRYSLEGELLSSWGEEGTEPGQMIFPTDVCPDPDGRTVWVCEYGGQRCRIMQFTRDGEFVREWGSGEYEYADLYRPMAIAVDGDGRLFVADAGNHRINIYGRDGSLAGSWGEAGDEPGRLKYPYDLAFAADGTLYVCEYGSSRISHFTADGGYLGSWGGPGHRDGELYSPWGVATAPDGAVVVADTNNGRILAIADPKAAFARPGRDQGGA